MIRHLRLSRLIHHPSVARGRQAQRLWCFATERAGGVLARTVRMRDRAKRRRRGAGGAAVGTVMNKAGLWLAGSLALGFVSLPAAAQTGSETVACGEEREIDTQLMSEGFFNRLNNAAELMGEEEFDEAIEILQDLERSRLAKIEEATVNQYLGFLAAQRERYRDAIEHFSQAVRLNVLPNNTHFDMILQIAQLYNAVEEYDLALEQLDFWFCISTQEEKKQAEVWVLKASLHVRKEEWREALVAIDEALALVEQPKEDWLQLKLGILLQLEDFAPAAGVLQTLISINPDRKDYWIQLSGVYMELGNNAEAMAAMRLAHRHGLLDKGAEFLQLAGLLQEMQSPRQAAEVMQEGLEKEIVEATARNWEMVAGAWYQAREMDKALAAYEKAGQLSESGNLDFQRASILAGQEEDWGAVNEAARAALNKGDLTASQEGNAWLLVGMAEFNLGRYDRAEQAFNNALNYGTVRGGAREWLNHIEQTRQRLARR